jgi:hypothetical protein
MFSQISHTQHRRQDETIYLQLKTQQGCVISKQTDKQLTGDILFCLCLSTVLWKEYFV